MAQHGVHALPIERLVGLSTPQLLAYRDRLLALEESFALSDLPNMHRRLEEIPGFDPAIMYFKEDPRWAPLRAALREVMASREHVPKNRRPSRRTKRRPTRATFPR